jgi:ABC-type lipoprotein release transport system permease subunit
VEAAIAQPSTSVVHCASGKERTIQLAQLSIACVGLYGVMAYAVSRRANEIEIRTALGAERRRIIWMVLREVLALAAAGIGRTLFGAWSARSLVASFLFGVGTADRRQSCSRLESW